MKRTLQLIAITRRHLAEINREVKELRRRERALAALNRRRIRSLQRPRITMFDSTEVDQIPQSAMAVAGYTGGKWPTFPELIRHFAHALRLSIAIRAHEDADCLDVERGDAEPDEAGPWARRQLKLGKHRPCLYMDRSNVPLVLASLRANGVRRSQVRLWVADPTGVPHIPDGFDACQYDWKALGRNLDASLCLPNFFE